MNARCTPPNLKRTSERSRRPPGEKLRLPAASLPARPSHVHRAGPRRRPPLSHEAIPDAAPCRAKTLYHAKTRCRDENRRLAGSLCRDETRCLDVKVCPGTRAMSGRLLLGKILLEALRRQRPKFKDDRRPAERLSLDAVSPEPQPPFLRTGPGQFQPRRTGSADSLHPLVEGVPGALQTGDIQTSPLSKPTGNLQTTVFPPTGSCHRTGSRQPCPTEELPAAGTGEMSQTRGETLRRTTTQARPTAPARLAETTQHPPATPPPPETIPAAIQCRRITAAAAATAWVAD